MPVRWRFQTSQIANVAIEVLWRPSDGERSGDFFDVLDLADDRVTLLLGTAPGGGRSAAVVADDLRYLLRRALHRSVPVVRALAELDRHLSQIGVVGTQASALVIVVNVLSGTALVVNAGHPPPILHDAGDNIFMDPSPDGLIGTHGERTPVSVSMGPTSSLVAFTPGLIERRLRTQLGAGLPLVRDVARQLTEPLGVLSLTRGIVAQIGQPTEDATIVSVRRAPATSFVARSAKLQDVG